jgi:hypothetical protein
MGMLLQSCDRENELFDVTYLYLPKLFPEFYGEIFLQDALGKEIHSSFSWGTPKKEMAMPDFAQCRAFTCGVVVNTREAMRAKRAGTSLGAIMVDLDHFKDVNNTFGHDAGDEVLRKMGCFFVKAL